MIWSSNLQVGLKKYTNIAHQIYLVGVLLTASYENALVFRNEVVLATGDMGKYRKINNKIFR